MACPVNHPFFQAFIFLIGALVVLARYARGAEFPIHQPLLLAAPILSNAGGLGVVAERMIGAASGCSGC